MHLRRLLKVAFHRWQKGLTSTIEHFALVFPNLRSKRMRSKMVNSYQSTL